MLVWNYQGVGNSLTVQKLKKFVQFHSLKIMILLNLYGVYAINTNSGLCILWDEDADLTIKLFAYYFIEFQVYNNVKDTTWMDFGVYANCDNIITCEQLHNLLLRTRLCNKVVLIGYFNGILSYSEKIGGRICSQTSLIDFRNFIE